MGISTQCDQLVGMVAARGKMLLAHAQMRKYSIPEIGINLNDKRHMTSKAIYAIMEAGRGSVGCWNDIGERMKKCPYCAETIRDGAVICTFCGRGLTTPRTLLQPVVAQKAAAQPKKRNKGRIILFVIVGICLLLWVITQTRSKSSPPSGNASSTLSESDALQAVQNWRPSSAHGLTCKEMFDSTVTVNKQYFGISDATVKWGVIKQSDTLFIVYADVKGETGWANFSWQVVLPGQEIIALGEINICKP